MHYHCHFDKPTDQFTVIGRYIIMDMLNDALILAICYHLITIFIAHSTDDTVC